MEENPKMNFFQLKAYYNFILSKLEANSKMNFFHLEVMHQMNLFPVGSTMSEIISIESRKYGYYTILS